MNGITKQLSMDNLRRRLLHKKANTCNGRIETEEDHLLEGEEPVSKSIHIEDSGSNKSNNSDSRNKKSESNVSPSLAQIPSSLITLTEAERKRLEDVLLQIGLKECGL
ncbi:Uncharacterized protein FKW44_017386 [Caligus rogercresseyi]|uniref:Uncharacterized protein n=1 Tax=Caligus rogercresseyi TaxID=217165 RepID=A0A7T8GSV5_CALRO|nr:Uncharacterized protein FKW44_017386 [Caligus rogercresseyi]|eukprot:TRINITY_DN14772_c0_g1_i1.p1 TRINITY_DN14772_c0_g1~~TRINITY_DN14772_c0_g1_i1.p1  ORF type:complete len:108 (-),score=35.61 TRINITY_DN14772_c0_g1_i1:74-397(-)